MVTSLMQELDMTEQNIRRRLKIVGFGPIDRTRVMALRELMDRHAEECTASFFEYLACLDEDSAPVGDLVTASRARQLKQEHLKAMARGDYGVPYVEERLQLASLYASAGMDPRVFLGAYHHLMRAIGFRVMESFKDSPVEGFDNFMSLKKIAFFDLTVMMDAIVHQRERIIRDQQQAIRELSTPVLQLRDGLLLLPVIGPVSRQRARQLTEDLLGAIRVHRARVVVVDITGVTNVDTTVANHLVQTVHAARLLGARVVVSGLSTQVTESLVTLGIEVNALDTVGDLQGGIEVAERALGYRVVPNAPRRPASGPK